jgi:hemerythrin-like metal-binding protein
MGLEYSFFLPDGLLLGVPEIDEQHRALFAQLDEIKAACVEKNHLPTALSEQLLLALREHFRTEECLAQSAGCDFAEHLQSHEEILIAIEKGLADAGSGTKDVFGVLRFLEYWFERHITEKDIALGRNLTGNI